jgi:hypothetical protein
MTIVCIHSFVITCKCVQIVSFDTVETFKRPNLEEITDEDLQMNIKTTWCKQEKEMIAEGFTAGWFSLLNCILLIFMLYAI